MTSVFLLLAAACGFVGVAMGAFGAHGLRHILTSEMLEVYKTAVAYQMWHTLGLGLVAAIQQQSHSKWLVWAGWMLFSGIVLFSGSLYLLTLLDAKWLGMVTPFGGVAFLAGWLLILIHVIKN
ncbi:MAG: DUF423 domain-containing protein [Gammaproteobacteria bacterium]